MIEYAQVDDHIRKLWLQLQQEQQKLLVSLLVVPGTGCVCIDVDWVQLLSEKKHKAMIETDREREKGQVKGMAIAKKAVEGQYCSILKANGITHCQVSQRRLWEADNIA